MENLRQQNKIFKKPMLISSKVDPSSKKGENSSHFEFPVIKREDK